MKGPRIRRPWPMLAPVVLAASLAACSSGSSGSSSVTSTSGGPELRSITIGVLRSADAVPVQIAVDKGFFKQEGLNVKLITETTTNAGSAGLLSHTMDFTDENYVGMLQQENSVPHLDLRVVADSDQAAPNNADLMVPKNSKITSISQLAGKKVAFPAPGVNFGSLAADVQLQAYHMSARDFTTVVMPFPEMPQAIATGTIDVAFSIEPFIALMEKKSGARVLTDLMTGPMKGFPVSCWATDASFAEKYPKTVAAFQVAIGKAARLAASDTALVRQELPKFVPTMSQQLANVIALPAYNSTLTLARMERVANTMIRLGALPANFDTQVRKMFYPPQAASG